MKNKNLLFTAAATLALITATKAQFTWNQLPSFPDGRAGHSFFSLGNKGYLIGGTNGTVTYNTVYEYDAQMNIWTQLSPMPINRAGAVAFSINGIGYVTLGGSISMDAYDPSTNTWTNKASFPSVERSNSIVFVIGTNAYVGLGMDNDGNVYSDLYKYNSISNTWSAISSFPTNRTATAAFAIDDKGYVGSGLINWNSPLQSDLFEYNPISNTWTQKASLPSVGRYAAIGFSMNGKGYIGTGEKANPSGLLNDIWEYDVVNDSWSNYTTYPGGGVNYAECFKINNEIFIGGGSPGWRSDFYNLTTCSNSTLITSPTNSITTGGTATFTATSSDPNPGYEWQSDFGQGYQTLNNYGNYSGVTTSSLTIANIQLSEHNQPIRVISTSGECIDTSNVTTIVIADTCINSLTDTTYTTVTDTLIINTLITSLAPPANTNIIKVFPNPASTELTIDYGNFALMSGYQLRIENSLGQQVFQTNINQQSDTISLATWGGNGLYFVHIVDPQGNTIDIRKIVLQ